MRKYLFIFKSELMSNLNYVFNILTGFIGYFIMLFILFNLWDYVYDNPLELINGYSKEQMVWYVIITEILWSTLGGRKLCKKIINDVQTGNIVYNINKPYSYIMYSLFSHLGGAIVKGGIYLVLAIIMGYCFVSSFPTLNILSILAVLLTGILATVISSLLVIFIGLFSFLVEDSNPFYWLYSKLILVAGTIFPIEYFPKVVQPILRVSPVLVTCYGPSKLFVDFSWNVFLEILLFQLIYLGVSYLLCYLVYEKGVKRLNVNGG